MTIKELVKNYYKDLVIVSLIFLLDRLSKLYVIYLDKISDIPQLFLSKF